MTDGNQTATPKPAWLRPILAIAAVAIVLTVASTAAVISLGGPNQASYPAGSPEAAFQQFVTAAQNGDWATADSLMSSTMRAQGQSSQPMVAGMLGSGVTVSIESSARSGNSATLIVSYSYSSSSLFGSSAYTNVGGVSMVLEAGGWKVDSSLYGGR